jgi:hypothetical protein
LGIGVQGRGGGERGCADLLEGVGRNDTLETLQLECVAGRKEVVVVDRLDSED